MAVALWAAPGLTFDQGGDMNQRLDPAAGAATGQLEAAIGLVERVFGRDACGGNIETVAAVLAAIRANHADKSALRAASRGCRQLLGSEPCRMTSVVLRIGSL